MDRIGLLLVILGLMTLVGKPSLGQAVCGVFAVIIGAIITVLCLTFQAL